jgi:hypothetical protein
VDAVGSVDELVDEAGAEGDRIIEAGMSNGDVPPKVEDDDDDDPDEVRSKFDDDASNPVCAVECCHCGRNEFE